MRLNVAKSDLKILQKALLTARHKGDLLEYGELEQDVLKSLITEISYVLLNGSR